MLILAFIVPAFYPYDYATQIRGSENLGPMQYSEAEQAAMAAGEKVFPHILGTDSLGRDYAVRVMMGTRVSPVSYTHLNPAQRSGIGKTEKGRAARQAADPFRPE